MKDKSPSMKDKSKVIYEGRAPKDHHGAVNIPPYRASTILFESVEKFLHPAPDAPQYGRHGTPTKRAFAEAISALEHAAFTCITPSGIAAVSTAILAAVEAGDHILISDNIYAPTYKFCQGLLQKFNISCDYFFARDAAQLEPYFQENTKLVITESPGSNTFEVQDIPEFARLAHARGALLAVDNTWATPLFFKPLEMGADFSILAGTKYIIGHADALIGTVACADAQADNLRRTHALLGQTAGSDDIYLALRGLRTLSTRLEAHQKSALEIARWLETLPFIERVLYPALTSHPDHDLWQRDFYGAAGLFSIVMDELPASKLAALLDDMVFFGMGYSWGGFESLMIPASLNRLSSRPWARDKTILRLSIGLEDVEDLRDDLAAGFKRASLIP